VDETMDEEAADKEIGIDWALVLHMISKIRYKILCKK